MEYNTTRNNLIISEYGRNIQKMIEYTLTMTDKEKRTKSACLIIEVMAQMHPQVKETNNYKQKLWDHLHIISDFKLDIDSPYPIPSKQALNSKPERIPYQSNDIKFKQYGKNLQKIIEKAIELEDGKEKEAFVKTIANHIKKSYLNWNRDSVNDELILKHLDILSNKKLKLPENVRLIATGDILSKNNNVGKKKKFTKKSKDKNGHHKKYGSY